METVIQDVRYGIRMLVKSPGFTAVAIVTLAFGIGANTALFGLISALFLRLPALVEDPNQLVDVFQNRDGRGYFEMSFPDYLYYRDHNTFFSGLISHYASSPLNLVAGADSRMITGSVVSGNYFSVLGVKPFLGRFFLPEEDMVPNRNPVAILSHGLWTSRFGSDPGIQGRTIKLNGTAFTVVGVAPEGFHGIIVGRSTAVWIPNMMFSVGYRWCDAFGRDCPIITMVGRLKGKLEIAEAQAEMTVLAKQLENNFPETNKNLGVSLVPVRGMEAFAYGRKKAAKVTSLLMAVLSVVLFIACANLAGLLLARNIMRRKEIAVRLSLGSSRWRLIRQLLVENVLLSVMGSVAGLIVASWMSDVLLSFYSTNSEGFKHSFELAFDPFVLACTAVLSIVTGLVFGLLPALQASTPDLVAALKGDGSHSGPSRSRLRGALVIAQVALSLVLLVGAGLLIHSIKNIYLGAGFNPDHVALLRPRPRLIGYTAQKAQSFHQEVLRRLEVLPGVQSVSLARGIGLLWEGGPVSICLPGHLPARPEDVFDGTNNEIAPRFFETLGIPLVKGRDFNEQDRQGRPCVAIVNETLNRRLWGESDSLGKIVIVNGHECEVVGVAKDAQYHSTLNPPRPFVYLPFWQNVLTEHIDSRMCVRVAGDPRKMLPLLRREIMAVDPSVPISEDMAMIEQLEGSFRSARMVNTILGYSGVLALSLSVIGLYGIVSFAVGQRSREIGIRMALGARQIDVINLFLRQGISLVMIGLIIGLVSALAFSQVLAAYLFGVSATDPFVFMTASALLAMVALLACYIPARRATKVDPIVALRYE